VSSAAGGGMSAADMLGVGGAAAGPTGGSDRERIVLSGGSGDVDAVLYLALSGLWVCAYRLRISSGDVEVAPFLGFSPARTTGH
jgi:hypothetical protein